MVSACVFSHSIIKISLSYESKKNSQFSYSAKTSFIILWTPHWSSSLSPPHSSSTISFQFVIFETKIPFGEFFLSFILSYFESSKICPHKSCFTRSSLLAVKADSLRLIFSDVIILFNSFVYTSSLISAFNK